MKRGCGKMRGVRGAAATFAEGAEPLANKNLALFVGDEGKYSHARMPSVASHLVNRVTG
jgi:hypothetical protein